MQEQDGTYIVEVLSSKIDVEALSADEVMNERAHRNPRRELTTWRYAGSKPDRSLGYAIDQSRGYRFLAGQSGG